MFILSKLEKTLNKRRGGAFWHLVKRKRIKNIRNFLLFCDNACHSSFEKLFQRFIKLRDKHFGPINEQNPVHFEIPHNFPLFMKKKCIHT